MKRLLCIVGSMNVGGAETFLMKIYRKLDRSQYQMDFCVTEEKTGVKVNWKYPVPGADNDII